MIFLVRYTAVIVHDAVQHRDPASPAFAIQGGGSGSILRLGGSHRTATIRSRRTPGSGSWAARRPSCAGHSPTRPDIDSRCFSSGVTWEPSVTPWGCQSRSPEKSVRVSRGGGLWYYASEPSAPGRCWRAYRTYGTEAAMRRHKSFRAQHALSFFLLTLAVLRENRPRHHLYPHRSGPKVPVPPITEVARWTYEGANPFPPKE
jgi:hypothetical protein